MDSNNDNKYNNNNNNNNNSNNNNNNNYNHHNNNNNNNNNNNRNMNSNTDNKTRSPLTIQPSLSLVSHISRHSTTTPPATTLATCTRLRPRPRLPLIPLPSPSIYRWMVVCVGTRQKSQIKCERQHIPEQTAGSKQQQHRIFNLYQNNHVLSLIARLI
jgi:hypothetical protein